MPSTTTTREIQINKRQKEETVKEEKEDTFHNNVTNSNSTPPFFQSTWEDDFHRLHGRLLTSGGNFREFEDTFWPVNDEFYKGAMETDSSVRVSNEGDVFRVTVESPDFRPEELKVSTLNDNLLKIEGRHVEEGTIENGNKYISRQFSRSYTLPSNCKVQEMKSSFGNGKLVISVPKSRPAITAENTRTETTNGVGKMAGNSNGNIHVTTTKHSSSNGGQTIRCIPIDRKMAGNSNGSTNIPIDRTYTSRATINTGDGDRYKTKEVNIDDDLEEDGIKTDDPMADDDNYNSLESWPECQTTADFKSKFFENWKIGGNPNLFPSWARPIELFDEDFCSFFNKAKEDFKASLSEANGHSKVEVKETDEQFQFVVDTDDYDPKELKVSVLEDVLKIEGQHQEEDSSDRGQDGSSKVKKRKVTKQFSRSYVLPKHIYRMDRVESSLNTRQKKLVVKVPKIKQLPNAGRGAITVPIKMV